MLLDYLKSWPLYVLPHHAISRLVFRLTRVRCPKVVPTAIRLFSKQFKVNLAEAEYSNPEDYQTFNAFFTRSLKAGVRTINKGKDLMVSPVDGRVSQVGAIQEGRIFQAKGHEYSALELLGGDVERAKPFLKGQFMTVYLSPRDYHRIHMPVSGKLVEQVYVPGRLFSVAGHTARTIPRLFARNERVVTLFETEQGLMAMVLVGAINVAAIETVWDGLVTPPTQAATQVKTFDNVVLEQGAEMGRFNMGSTVILLFADSKLQWESNSQADQAVQLGQVLAKFQ